MLDNNIMELTSDEFNLTLEDNEVVFVDFWATWCGPCKMLAPIIAQIANEYADKAVFAKVDIDNNTNLAQNFAIQSIPTVIIFKNGKEIDRAVGLRNADAYRKMLNDALN